MTDRRERRHHASRSSSMERSRGYERRSSASRRESSSSSASSRDSRHRYRKRSEGKTRSRDEGKLQRDYRSRRERERSSRRRRRDSRSTSSDDRDRRSPTRNSRRREDHRDTRHEVHRRQSDSYRKSSTRLRKSSDRSRRGSRSGSRDRVRKRNSVHSSRGKNDGSTMKDADGGVSDSSSSEVVPRSSDHPQQPRPRTPVEAAPLKQSMASESFPAPPDSAIIEDGSPVEASEDIDEEMMQRMMGFGSFDTSKNKSHTSCDAGGVNTRTKRRYRQYMNRKGGFNRPLSPVF